MPNVQSVMIILDQRLFSIDIAKKVGLVFFSIGSTMKITIKK